MLALFLGAVALAACQNEAERSDIEVALQACGIEAASIRKNDPDDGVQSPFQVDLGAAGAEDAACLNQHIRAAGLKPVLTFHSTL